MALNSLLEVIKKVQEKNPAFSARMAEAQALSRWEIAVGETISRHSKAIRVQNSVLWVEVAHPIWRAELHYRKQQILNILNQKPSDSSNPILKDIIFVAPRYSTSY